ncbi:amidase [Lentibacillus populi]|uniref:Amidase n=1 Tax=Lentibacillus populi TaxID=1827502 RepID=A0A9W5TY74_9BACI|nr:amidase [Lentibacillus populi]GGB43720.1 amidase [Lentibacillus populi]
MDKHRGLYANSIAGLSVKMKDGGVSPTELVKDLIARIERIDKDLNSFITFNRNALVIAEEREQELQFGKYRGPLHGIPIGLKDVIFTKGIRTTMGSEIFKDYIPAKDAFVVEQLKKAGAIIVGKLNTHQFAYGPTGDRSYYGVVANPHDKSKMSGGSSSGSAAAVAACLCYGALGTDTGGSIRIPSSFCGIVGMKPTYGSISKRGVYPLSWVLDHVGPMTRTITDNAIMLNAIIAYDKEDPDAIYRKPEDYTRLIGKDVKDIKIGIPEEFYYEDLDAEVDTCIQDAIKCLERLGVKMTTVNIPSMHEFSEAHKVILRSDAYAIHAQNLLDYPTKWDDEVKERLITALDTKGYDYAKAMRTQKLAKQEYREVLDTVDALITPTMSILPPNINERHTGKDKSDEHHIRWTITKLTAPTNLSGFPSLTLPCGFSADRMPIGVQLIGKEFDEAKLYQIGYALEQALLVEVPVFD